MSVTNTLNQRAKTHGHFPDVAKTSQLIRSSMEMSEGWELLNTTQVEALTVIAQKIARILCGDPNYIDNWHDIAGYATLVEEALTTTEGATNSKVVRQIVINSTLQDI